MFLRNKYTQYYNDIVSNGQRFPTDSSVYSEKHHIVPKSLGGSNDPENLVRLTAREHFVCHRLLVKMVEGDSRTKMAWALWRMAHPRKYVELSSKDYDIARKTFSEVLRIAHTGRDITWADKMRGKRPNVNQTGKNNNAWKGRSYKTPWGIFDSIGVAVQQSPLGINISTLYYFCKAGSANQMVKTRNKHNLVVGKTYSEQGFALVEGCV